MHDSMAYLTLRSRPCGTNERIHGGRLCAIQTGTTFISVVELIARKMNPLYTGPHSPFPLDLQQLTQGLHVGRQYTAAPDALIFCIL